MADILLIGAARSGIAAARLLAGQGNHVILTDMKEVEQKEQLEAEGIEVYDNGHPEFLKEKDYDYIVKNPGIPYRAPLVKYFQEKNVPIYTEIETAFRAAPNFTYGAVTGTDGKTTIVTLLHEMLKRKNQNAFAAGNIGTPLSEAVLQLQDQPADIALELSNFQLLGIDQFRPHVSLVSNLAPDHLDYMDSLEDYYKSKFEIYRNCTKDDYFIRNIDDPEIVKYAVNIPASVIDFSLKDENADLRIRGGKAMLWDQVLFDPADLKLVGDFNLGNAMMAAATAYLMGVSLEDIQTVIREFPGVEHRIEYVGTHNGVRIYNDSKATNTHSAEAALSSFDGNVILLCGGKNKGIDYTVLKEFDSRIKHCFSFGEIRDVFKDIFTSQTSVETMEEALDKALDLAEEGDVILLCPATSSFDQFKNYEVRGEIFKELVKERISK
ncbi:MAG: UDP-N-acetylmuramoyl-L-alanine--D-glutamate ligase [Erysipelotrichaceae bacterium]|nr:UDP-N-acetylmuramoyl-L-alanine--D-glutamate ligase [Erysipelotrichaceae bacterium]